MLTDMAFALGQKGTISTVYDLFVLNCGKLVRESTKLLTIF